MNLSSNELTILQALWDAPRPLTRKEILAMCSTTLRCKKRTIYVVLNGLIEKKLIYVAGYIYNGDRSSRVFAPSLSQVEYSADVISNLLPLEKYTPLINLLQHSVDTSMCKSETSE